MILIFVADDRVYITVGLLALRDLAKHCRTIISLSVGIVRLYTMDQKYESVHNVAETCSKMYLSLCRFFIGQTKSRRLLRLTAFYRATLYTSAVYGVVACLSSVCPSVCLSVTSRHCIKIMAKHRITQTPYDSAVL